ncbi:hypothetical protein ACFQ9Y_26020 [Peribacillus simplex]|uniref:hypothetical protein n=1 Tax=Peribacillus simplex TaxID=1478 RepID=UPI00366F60F9
MAFWGLGGSLAASWHAQRFKEGIQRCAVFFLSGFILQIINVKSILFYLTVLSAFILPFNESLKFIVTYLAITIFLGWMALLLWSGFGSLFKDFFAKHDKPFRLIMCLLLIYSAGTMFV